MPETQTPTLPSVAEYESVSTELMNGSVSLEDITTALGRIRVRGLRVAQHKKPRDASHLLEQRLAACEQPSHHDA
jgi:hypothetical protein